ncbi:MAG TPA: transglutaminase-like domain-containing protein [Thermoanaerobaculia bacterium]|nr:transglutaminase-like domain-containing protein [Thermoanaerobaculia bacterium]
MATADAADPSAPRELWLGMFLGEAPERRRVGAIHLQRAPETRRQRPGVVLRMTLAAELELFARTTDLRLAGELWRADSGSLAELALRVDSGEAVFALDGRVEGGRLRATVTSAGEANPLELAVPAELGLSGGLGTSLTLPRLEPGERARVETLDPLTLRVTSARVRALREERLQIAGEEVEALALEIDAGGFVTRAWIDRDGEVLRATTPLGLELERISAAEALRPAQGAGDQLLRLTAVAPSGERPLRGARSLRLRVSGISELPSDSTQAVGDDGLVTIEPGAGDRDPEPLDAHLGADAFVQSGHPAIVEQARAVVAAAGPTDRERARAIHDWVHQEIAKEPVLSIPSALEVLASRRGDCNEHTVLYTALARAAGVPTRIAIGLVWSDELAGFYYHAWPEVFLDGRWHWTDPTLGQPTADATHLKLLNGGIETWTGILPALGRIGIEVLEVRK